MKEGWYLGRGFGLSKTKDELYLHPKSQTRLSSNPLVPDTREKRFLGERITRELQLKLSMKVESRKSEERVSRKEMSRKGQDTPGYAKTKDMQMVE